MVKQIHMNIVLFCSFLSDEYDEIEMLTKELRTLERGDRVHYMKEWIAKKIKTDKSRVEVKKG
ncbi:hypothetical protein [Alkalicoccobacillus plakortidis]|uniref:Uncharacterized protein n=1 Tax=Alkalicoccobacillus plakortidis TaxID=444060 RepID=A0ABT0XLR2_9BACI|nr:hypothetical protein [Alkalicoccobacillus plakortidis]MCM2676665.1 hypothetical protein [Alkalicoccobacillus plakortidis]